MMFVLSGSRGSVISILIQSSSTSITGGSTEKIPLIFLTSHLPARGSSGDTALRAAGTLAFHDAMEMYDEQGQARLAAYASGDGYDRPLTGFWTDKDIR